MLVALLLGAVITPLQAYDNDGRDADGNGLMKGGPHRTINELALNNFIARMAKEKDPIIQYYDFDKGKPLLGLAVTEPGMEKITEGDRNERFRWWIAEGGYTADEPELYNSFRHFYDPMSRNGAPYLTDHLQQLDAVYRFWIYGTPVGNAVGMVTGSDFNPHINAKDWGITGDKGTSFWENQYCWKKGLTYMQQAFASKGDDKRRLFVKAWRSLGETMHLLADMSCVPHVRNDSHPGKGVNWDLDPDKGLLKNDPYELLCTEGVVRNYGGYAIDPKVGLKVFAAKTPDELFEAVSLYTNNNFFSADTISGTYVKNKGTNQEQTITVTPANGCPAYDLPKLSDMRYDQAKGYFYSTLNGREVCMLNENWTSSVGWSEDKANSGYSIPQKCVYDQARILIPVAVYGNSKLVDLFLPRIQVSIDDVDYKEKILRGSVKHIPYGAFDKEMVYNSADEQYARLYIDNKPLTSESLEIKDGKFEIDLSDIDSIANAKDFAIEIEIGGLLVHSSAGGKVNVIVCKRKDEIPEDQLGAQNPFEALEGFPLADIDVTCSYTQNGKPVTKKLKTDKNGTVAFPVPLNIPVTITARGESKTVTATAKSPAAYASFGWQGHEINLKDVPSVSVAPQSAPPPIE